MQLNADFVLHKICDLGAVMYQFIFYFFCVGFQLVTQFNKNNLENVCRIKISAYICINKTKQHGNN